MSKNVYNVIQELKKFCEGGEKIYIYGAGEYGVRCERLLRYLSIPVEAFMITNIEKNNSVKFGHQKEIDGVKIVEFNKQLFNDCAEKYRIIIAVSSQYYSEIIGKIKELPNKILYLLYSDATPMLEVTSKIGCTINCKFCPQKLLVQNYCSNEANKKKIYLDLDDFKNYLNNVPTVTRIRFCGMSEPFLNKDCANMIEYASRKGHVVDCYTTLVGLQYKDVDKVLDNVESIIVHIPDEERNADIPLTKDYIKVLQKVLSYKRYGKRIVPILSCHGTVNSQITNIIPQGIPISNEMQDRAGNLNLQEENLLHWNKLGPITCSICEHNNILNNNILLPNGDVLLCCMDYSLDYILGNLGNNTYEDISNSEKLQLIRYEMLLGNRELICRHCSMAKELFG